MATLVHAFLHHVPDGSELIFYFSLFPPYLLVFHNHFINQKSGFHAPVQQIAGCINRKRKLHCYFLRSPIRFPFNKAAANGIISFCYGRMRSEISLKAQGIGMIGKGFLIMEFNIC